MDQKMKGKTVIITGANTGIGYETALGLAKLGARIILACRDSTRANEACAKLIKESKNKNIEVELIDLSKLKSIREFCDRIKLKLKRLDVLINNAGIVQSYYTKTEDGFEKIFAVNHLGPYLLTRLLLDLLKKSAPSRIVTVSSVGHRAAKIRWDNLQAEKWFFSFQTYMHSKLLNVLFTTELTTRLKGTGVTAVSLHPGVVYSEIIRNDQKTSYWMQFINLWSWLYFRYLGLSAADGALTSIYCASSDDIPNHPGAYFNKCKVEEAAAEGTNPDSAKKLWSLSAKFVGLDEDD